MLVVRKWKSRMVIEIVTLLHLQGCFVRVLQSGHATDATACTARGRRNGISIRLDVSICHATRPPYYY